jgi:hypothetical protein
VFAEPLSAHPTLAAFGGGAGRADEITDIDLHHNLFANTGWRNVLADVKRIRFVNNAVYNWSRWATRLGGGINADVIGNVYKRGPYPAVAGYSHEIGAWPGQVHGTESSGTMSLYVTGNKGPNNSDPAANNWASMVQRIRDSNNAEIGLLPTTYQRSTPLAPAGVPIVAESANTVQTSLEAAVGASRRLACDGTWVAARDAADARLIREFVSGTAGFVPTTQADVGGYPTITQGAACADSDSDGMPDAWETARGLDPRNPSDRNGTSVRPPYTNLEAYLGGSP